MQGSLNNQFVRPRFTPLPSGQSASQLEDISCLPDLIRFNGERNPDSTFCIQAEPRNDDSNVEDPKDGYSGVFITFEQLDAAVRACARWLSQSIAVAANDDAPQSLSPVALYLESDVGLFIYLMALQTLNVPVSDPVSARLVLSLLLTCNIQTLLISARLSASNVQHLLEETNSRTILVSKRTSPLLEGKVDGSFEIRTVQPYATYLHCANGEVQSESHQHGRSPESQVNRAEQNHANNTRRDLILHSSGTTGFPKPIYLTKRYLLQYAACHEFPPSDKIGWVNMTTLPLYHGFGLLAPGLSLSIGMTCCFPPSSIIPAGQSTLDLLDAFNCQSLMTVPSIVDDLMKIDRATQRLSSLEFLAVGGGALSINQGTKLSSSGVSLLNHYGVTEIGAIAHIFKPSSDYDWRYLRLRSDLDLKLRPIKGSQYFKLIGHPVGWDGPFEVQDELERNPNAPHGRLEIRIRGRTDDLIVLKTGEKVMPQHLENALNADSSIETAVCLGKGRFEVVVLVEPNEVAVSGNTDGDFFINRVWKLIQAANLSLDRHAQITSKKAIIVKPADKVIPRTDKGSVSRKQVYEDFSHEIEVAYAAIEDELPLGGLSFYGKDMNEVVENIRQMTSQIFSHSSVLSADDDLFEHGMDSLQAVRLARYLSAAGKGPSHGTIPSKKIGVEFVYANPTPRSLATAMEHRMAGSVSGDGASTRDQTQKFRMAELVQRFTTRIRNDNSIQNFDKLKKKHVVLLTGATGNLGAHTLARLLETASVDKIVCLYRQPRPTNPRGEDQKPQNGDDGLKSSLENLEKAIVAAGITLDPASWSRVELVGSADFLHHCQSEQAAEQHCTSSKKSEEYRRANGLVDGNIFKCLSSQVTHIIHLAWPMDFQRTLESFDPHFRMIEALVRLARSAYVDQSLDSESRVRLIFSSSIATVRNYKGLRSETSTIATVPEVAMEDTDTVAPIGYAQAKWVCEHILDQTARSHGNQIDAVVVRIGQLSGPEDIKGIWKTGEHMPTLVKASKKIGAFPLLKGKISWLPVDRAARSLVEMSLYPGELAPYLHLENPVRVPATDVFSIMAYELGISRPSFLPYEDWLQKARDIGAVGSLSEFFENDFQDLALGDVTLDTSKARTVSRVLRGSKGIEKSLLVRYIQSWTEQGLFS